MSKTPLTDALVEQNKQLDNLEAHNQMLDHARKLEADRAELVEALQLMTKYVNASLAGIPLPSWAKKNEEDARALLARLEADK